MLFYEMCYKMEKPLFDEKTDVKSEKRKLVNIINRQNREISKTMRFDILETNDYNIILTVSLENENRDDIKEKAVVFLSSLGVCAKLISVREITLHSYMENIDEAGNNGFIDNVRSVLLRVGDDVRRYQYCESYREKIIDETLTMEGALKKARKIFSIPELESEIERIYKGAAIPAPEAHPIQYAVFSDSEIVRKKIRELLVSSLFSVGRLKSRRISFVGLDSLEDEEDDTFDGDEVEQIYDVQHGSTLIFTVPSVKYTGGIRKNSNEEVLKVCKSIWKYHRDTLTIIEMRKKGKETFSDIREALPDIKFVVFDEKLIDAAKAKKMLETRAHGDEIKEVGTLLAEIEESANYYSADLDKIYTKWFDERLCSEVYPQYKDIVNEKSTAVRSIKGSAYKDLENLIGLDDVKRVVKSAVDYNKAQKIFHDNGLHAENMCCHMVFTGNPGSAKTTVARLFAQIMKDNQILSTGNLIEVGRADIVDRFVGGTAPRVKDLFRRAEGNVLFIDEAYSLYDGDRGLFGEEAVNAIVQEMENHRDDTIVIFAGYPDKMETFLSMNPGLRSRIAFHVNFDDYSENELWHILNLFASSNEMTLSPGVEEKVRPILREAMKYADFGNGRFVRNLYEGARRRQALRIVQKDEKNLEKAFLTTLIADDFERIEHYTEEDKPIGFAR